MEFHGDVNQILNLCAGEDHKASFLQGTRRVRSDSELLGSKGPASCSPSLVHHAKLAYGGFDFFRDRDSSEQSGGFPRLDRLSSPINRIGPCLHMPPFYWCKL